MLRALERLDEERDDDDGRDDVDEEDDVKCWVAGKSKVKDGPSRSSFKVADHW